MPLPTDDVAWPPTDERMLTNIADWEAWYSSDPIALELRYGYRGWRHGVSPQQQPHARGMFGFLQRWFWGVQTPPGEQITKLHVPLAGDIARTSSDLLFSEPPAFVVDDDENTQQALDNLTGQGLHATLLEGAELCSALGGVYLRVVWDDEVSDRPWIDAVSGDCAHPEFSYGRLTAVTFWTVLDQQGETVWRHLERHEKGRIYHGLFEGSPSRLGRAKPLPEHPSTAALAAIVDAEGGLDTGAPDHLSAVYIPNVRPARGWRHIPASYGWGQSDYQGVESLMDALDEVYTSWMRDVRLAKGRVIVPQSMLDSHGPGRGGHFNTEREIFSPLNMLQRPGDTGKLDVVQFAIRVQEHKDTAHELMEQAVRQAGYSGSSFGLSEAGQAVTATEIRARDSRSIITRNRKGLYWDPELSRILAAWLAVCIGPRFGVDGLTVTEPIVERQDGIADSPQELAQTAALLRQAEAASTDSMVRLMHPGWDDSQVAQEVAAILGESGRAAPDPVGAFPM